MTGAVTVISKLVIVVEHCPPAGVNVYVVVPTDVVLITAGFHVPVILFVEVAGSKGGMLFWHSGPICANAGVIWVATVISKVEVAVAHCPAADVNV